MKSQEKLKPCPFCSGNARILPQTPTLGLKTYLVKCDECGAKKLVVSRFLKQVVAEWNQRPIMIVSQQVQERLDMFWYRLQRIEEQPGISQIDLDEKCVARLKQLANYLEAEAKRMKKN